MRALLDTSVLIGAEEPGDARGRDQRRVAWPSCTSAFSSPADADERARRAPAPRSHRVDLRAAGRSTPRSPANGVASPPPYATRGGQPRRRALDLAIAATANVHDVPLLTHNTRRLPAHRRPRRRPLPLTLPSPQRPAKPSPPRSQSPSPNGYNAFAEPCRPSIAAQNSRASPTEARPARPAITEPPTTSSATDPPVCCPDRLARERCRLRATLPLRGRRRPCDGSSLCRIDRPRCGGVACWCHWGRTVVAAAGGGPSSPSGGRRRHGHRRRRRRGGVGGLRHRWDGAQRDDRALRTVGRECGDRAALWRLAASRAHRRGSGCRGGGQRLGVVCGGVAVGKGDPRRAAASRRGVRSAGDRRRGCAGGAGPGRD